MPTAEAPRFDVVVVNHNSATLCSDLVRTLAGSGVPARIVVVDSGSSQPVTAATFPGADEVIAAANYGYGTAINLAATVCTSPVLVVMNADVRIAAPALRALVATLRECEAFAASPLLDEDGRRVPLSLRPYVPPSRFLRKKPAHLEARDGVVRTEYVHGAVMALDRARFAALGGFDEGFFLYKEEDDLVVRATAAGEVCVVVLDAVATHVGGASSAGYGNAWREAQRLRGTLRFVRKHYGPLDVAITLLVDICLLVSRAGLRATTDIARHAVRPPRSGLDFPPRGTALRSGEAVTSAFSP